MIEIRKQRTLVVVYDESENRGIAYPVKQTIGVDVYVAELRKLAANMKYGMIIIPLIPDSLYFDNYYPLKRFMDVKKRKYKDLERDLVAEQLYNFYFKHAVLQIGSESASYIFYD